MKKLLLLALAIITILCFASCGTNNSSQKNDVSTDPLKQAIDSISSINSLSYTTKSESIWKSDTKTITTIETTENKAIKEPFVRWSKTVSQTNSEPKVTRESYAKTSEEIYDVSMRREGGNWENIPIKPTKLQSQELITFSNNLIEGYHYLLNANLDSFKMDDNQDGLIKYSGTISQSSIIEVYKQYIRDYYISINLLDGEIDKEISNDEVRKEITNGKPLELMVGIPGLAYADKPIPITIWVREKDNTISKVQIDKIDVSQGIFDVQEKSGLAHVIFEKAILTFEVIGIDTFDELPMPE